MPWGLRCKGCELSTRTPFYVHNLAGLISALGAMAIAGGLLVIVQPLLDVSIWSGFKAVCLLMVFAVFIAAGLYFYSMAITIWLKKTG
ncbi:MAG: hypothetical protein OEY28_09425, partial [Nitrospira sp.]|nr:hypothetical protein [Nitrospira sp.]